MHWARRSNERFIRIALALLVVVALAPTLSRVLSFAQGLPSALAVVCSVDAANRSSPSETGISASAEHCPLCSLQVQGWHPMTAWSLWGLLPVVGDVMPLLFLWVACPLFAWAAAQPRGPPALA